MFKELRLNENQKNYLIIFLLSLHVIFWAEPGRIIIGGDVTLPKLSSMLYAWFNSTDAGYPFASFTWIIWNGFLEILSYISLDFAYKIYYLLLTFASGAGMYYFASTLTNDDKRVPLLAAVIYMFNPFIFTAFTILYVYAVIPLMTGFFIKGLKTLKLKYFTYFSFVSPILFLVFPNLTFPLITLILMAFFLPFYADFGKKRIKKTLKVLLLFPLIFILINAWWLVPSLYNILSFFDPLGEIREVTIPTFSFSLESAFRWLGVWAFESFDTGGTFQGKLYYPFIEIIQTNPLLIFLTFLPSVLAFFALYLKPKDRNVILFFFLALIALFFSKGPNEPFGSLYSWLLSNISFFKFFRDTNRFMFIVTFAYSFLIAISIRHISSRFKGMLRTAVPMILVGLLLINSWPLITGDVAVNWYDSEHRGVKIPSFYYEANEWFNEQEDYYRIFILPRPPHGDYIANKWGYQGSNILHYMMSKPLITGSTFGGTYIKADDVRAIDISQLYTDFSKNKSKNFGKILGLLNVKYIVVDRSVDTEFYGTNPISYTTELLECKDGIEKSVEFEDLVVYKNKFFIPHIYATSNVTYFPGTLESPESVGWTNNMKYATLVEGNLSVENGVVKISGYVNGSHKSFPIEKTLSINPKEYRYMLVDFYTDDNSDIMVQLETKAEIVYPLASNPPQYENVPANPALNHYRSSDPYTLIFKLPDGIKENITKIVIFAANQINLNHVGEINVWIGNVSFVKSIGLIEDEKLDVHQNNVILFGHQLSTEQRDFIENISKTGDNMPTVSVKYENPTYCELNVESSSPYFLVFGENFNSQWEANINGKKIDSHFIVNGYANGWYIKETGKHTVVIEFFPQKIFLFSIILSIISIFGLVYITIIKRYELC